MDRKELAVSLFSKGYNCAQAVALAFADKVNISDDVLARVSAPFGGGVGRMREVCGAVSGMVILMGLAINKDLLVPENKLALYKLEQQAAATFKENACGSIVCRELLALHAHGEAECREKTGCKDLIKLAVSIIEEMNIFD